MFSLVKLALFSVIAFATLALAIPSARQTQDPQPLALNATANATAAIKVQLLTLNNVCSLNPTPVCIGPVFQGITAILMDLTSALKAADLAGCGCIHDVIRSIAIILEIIFKAIYALRGSFSIVEPLLGDLVAAIVALVSLVISVAVGLVGELLILLISNGCAGILLTLPFGILSGLINLLCLNGLLGVLGGPLA